MSLQELSIEITAESFVDDHKVKAIDINMLPNSPIPISFEDPETKFDANTAGLGLGLLWAAILVFLGLVATLTGIGAGLVEWLGSVHVGYKPTLFGTFMGAISGLVYGFIIGAIMFRVLNVIFVSVRGRRPQP